MDLQGKNTVVTGAGRGIGAALAREFHARGANVVLADLAGAAETATSIGGDRVVGLVADVSSEDGNRRLIDEASAAFGPIDLFFANAGVGGGTTLADTDEDAWAAAFNINVHAHRWAAKYLLPDWIERGDGYFCSTASAAGVLAQIGSAPYTMTKRAAVAFAEYLSITYGDAGIKVTCLCPQGVNTEMLHGGDDPISGSNVVKAAADVLEPDDVAVEVADTIEAETFFVLPHPEVADYMQFKAADPDRWLGGMRKLQRRVAEG
ncbi:SDR family oxidoreductase [Ilumatobacter nonamiensis]|uniref:SDR family oxidoreductase n=1 Tax=Ilumatobacter nonamiensis TaxID=467093 RepID=UPI00034CB419|nr:SDR family oxidoreductase [Ilumatobacter nonamiensis]